MYIVHKCPNLMPFSRSNVGSASDSRAIGPGFDTQSGHFVLFLCLLIQEGQCQLLASDMCTKYWLTT